MSDGKRDVLLFLESSTKWLDESSRKKVKKSSSWKERYYWLFDDIGYGIEIDWRDLVVEAVVVKLSNGRLPRNIGDYGHPMKKDINWLVYNKIIDCGRDESDKIRAFNASFYKKRMTVDDFKKLIEIVVRLLKECMPTINKEYVSIFR